MTKIPVTALKPVYHDGKTYEIGAKFDMAETHVPDSVRTGLVVERVDVEVEKPIEPATVFASENEELVALKAVWDAESPSMTATQYLEKFPQGPAGDLAMRIVELEAELAPVSA